MALQAADRVMSVKNADGRVPQRQLGRNGNTNLPPSVSIIGLGCSSFSTFFWTGEEQSSEKPSSWTPAAMDRNHPRVQEWIRTIHYAVVDCGITLLDTAPWYGHGTSEVVIGWAWEELKKEGVSRNDLLINTKIGRYEADPAKMFDFSYDTTLKSVQRSLRRMKCDYINVLQLHDPEFAPSIDQLLQETIPAMATCQRNGWCRALGMTGYPLEVQHQILQRSLDKGVVWDQTLVYGHFNLHDSSLFTQPNFEHQQSFADYCRHHSIVLTAAAPLSMGLLTHTGPPEWHPASNELKEACLEAASICESHGVNISTLATVVALSNPRIPCTIVGVKNVQEVQAAAAAACRFDGVDDEAPQKQVLQKVLTPKEYEVWELLQDPSNGPFASVWSNGRYKWDGVQEAADFWKQLETNKESGNES